MATVSFDHIGYITAISPGATHHVSWNNAAAQRVWAFSVDTMLSLTIPPAVGTSARLEITHVEYREVYNGPANLEKEIREKAQIHVPWNTRRISARLAGPGGPRHRNSYYRNTSENYSKCLSVVLTCAHHRRGAACGGR